MARKFSYDTFILRGDKIGEWLFLPVSLKIANPDTIPTLPALENILNNLQSEARKTFEVLNISLSRYFIEDQRQVFNSRLKEHENAPIKDLVEDRDGYEFLSKSFRGRLQPLEDILLRLKAVEVQLLYFQLIPEIANTDTYKKVVQMHGQYSSILQQSISNCKEILEQIDGFQTAIGETITKRGVNIIQDGRFKFAIKSSSELRDFVKRTAGEITETTDFGIILKKFLDTGKPVSGFKRTELQSIQTNLVHVATIDCKTQVNIFIGTISDKRCYIIVE